MIPLVPKDHRTISFPWLYRYYNKLWESYLEGREYKRHQNCSICLEESSSLGQEGGFPEKFTKQRILEVHLSSRIGINIRKTTFVVFSLSFDGTWPSRRRDGFTHQWTTEAISAQERKGIGYPLAISSRGEGERMTREKEQARTNDKRRTPIF